METRDRATVEFERLQAAVARSDDGLEQGLKLNSGEIMEREQVFSMPVKKLVSLFRIPWWLASVILRLALLHRLAISTTYFQRLPLKASLRYLSWNAEFN